MVQPWLSYAALPTVAAAAGLFAWRLRRGVQSATVPHAIARSQTHTMRALAEAAAAAYETARLERLPIATVIENDKSISDPISWFARSIVRVVPAFRKSDAGDFVHTEDAVGATLQDLYIRNADYRVYVDWTRTLQ